MTITVPFKSYELRRREWERAWAGTAVEGLETISERYHLPGAYIRQLAQMARVQARLDATDVVGLAQVQAAYHTLNRHHLDSLATYLPVSGSWDEVVVGDFTRQKLNELARRCYHRERLLDHLGSAFAHLNNRGVRALFTGSSGTGKTLAARVLAAELGMDLYRVDLAAVVNKYIGETEKNLHRVLSRAEALDVILLLDEGDALLGNRTEVRSANDRYANLETDYLLQRLEHYQGIVIITTNAGENIDRAFQRRMDIVVSFVPPEAEERWQIWQLHLPPVHLVPEDYLQQVAIQCQLNGGQIRNAALLATLLALDEGQDQPLLARHLEQALQSEYRKAGATFPLHRNGMPLELEGMTTFLDAFMRS
jgi:SpoVK/Ycf46/Vps4 family AAA+-type ATPase